MIYIIVFIDENLQKLQKRDSKAIENLYKEYKDKIFNFLIIKTNGNRDIVEEIFSDTFHSAIINLPKLKNADNLQAWLIQIASRRLNDYFRKDYREKKYLEKIINQESYTDPVFETIEKRQEVVLLDMAMNNLKNSYKEVINLKYIEKKSLKEISKKLGKTIFSINNLLLRARAELNQEIKKILKEF